ncbi:MAG TPA: hypothetical protein VFV64_02560, partial [Permianibacter sp.]|nr:hypothetical protein [Permianibacter sp.]
MLVMKFGGSSLAKPERLQQVGALIRDGHQRNQGKPIGVVVSALGGVTDQLVRLLAACQRGDSATEERRLLRQRHLDMLAALASDWPASLRDQTAAALEQRLQQLNQDLDGVHLLRACPDEVQARVLACGEQLSVLLVESLLRASELRVQR